MADLENSLGATLLKRSTRDVKLTEVGQRYYTQVLDILNQPEQSNETVRSYQAKPMGHLHISSMVGFDERISLPLLDECSQLYPDIVPDVSLCDELSALSRDDVDMAIREGYAPNERVIAIKLMANQFIPVAAPSYLADMGNPQYAVELKQYKGLYFRTPNGPTPWLSYINGQWQGVSAPQVAVSNNGKWLGNLAAKAKGILMAPRWAAAHYLASGKLVELVLEPQVQITRNNDMAVYLQYQKQRYLVPKVKDAVDFLVARVK